jgi:uncharacterized protein
MSVEIHHAPAESRYEITVDGELAGFAQYRDEDGKRVFPHTEIEPRFEGNGYGTQVVEKALEDTRAAGLEIVPLCPFVRDHIEKHPV